MIVVLLSFLITLLRWFSRIVAVFSIILCVYAIFEKSSYPYFKEVSIQLRNFAPNVFIFFVVAMVSLIITSPMIHDLIGLHNIYLKEYGTYCFYVEIDGDVLPAGITVEKETGDDEGEKTVIHYYLRCVDDNGRIITFKERENSVFIGKLTTVYDDEGYMYDCKLLNEHAYSKNIKETSDADVVSVVLFLIQFVPISLVLIALKKYPHQQND